VFDLARKTKSRGKVVPWNKGKQVGQKLPLTAQQIRSIRSRLKADHKLRELALLDLAIDSSLCAIDLVRLRVRQVAKGSRILARTTIMQIETQRPLEFELTAQTRDSVGRWITHREIGANQYLFPTRLHASPFISVRQYARLIESWVSDIGLDARRYGTESLRRTKPALLYRRTRSLPQVQRMLRHVKLESTARYLGKIA
jgi:integrase